MMRRKRNHYAARKPFSETLMDWLFAALVTSVFLMALVLCGVTLAEYYQHFNA